MKNPNGSTPGFVIEAFSKNVANTRFQDLDQAAVEIAKNRIIDVLGCLIGGANAPGNRALLDLVKNWGGKKESSILVHGGKGPAQNVAMLNTIMARSFDFEVMSYAIDGQYYASHHAATLVPTALALAEATGANGREMLTAMLVGDDMAARVQTASKIHPIQLGWDGCGTVPHIGATATASRLLGLNGHQTQMAFGIDLNLIAGAIQSLWDGATTFKLGQGMAARNGIFSAELAKAGWTGVEDALQSRFGYFFLYGGGLKDTTVMMKDLGKKFYGEAYFKPFPSGLPTHAGIDAALSIVHKYNIQAKDITGIDIILNKGTIGSSYYAKPFVLREFPHGDAIFSYPYTVCSTLLKKSCNLYNFTEEAIMDPEVNRLTNITNLVEAKEDFDYRLKLELKVRVKDGREFSEIGTQRREWVKQPIPRDEILNKFWHQVEFSKTVSQKNAKKLVALVSDLENVEDVRKVIELVKSD